MTTRKERELLLAEIGTLEGFLRELPPGRIIERNGFEARLAQAQARLAQTPAEGVGKPLTVTFSGLPVEGSRSIAADFAGKALLAFTEAVKVIAIGLRSSVDDTRRLPSPDERGLRLVDTAVGSFGFALELPPAPPTQVDLFEHEQDHYERAIRAALGVLRDASTSDEAGLSDLVSEMQPRAAKKVRDFAELLARAAAGFDGEFEGTRVRLASGEEARRVVEALRDDDLGEEERWVRGTVAGVLPTSRRFELRLEDGSVIAGVLDRLIGDAEAFKRAWVDRVARIHLRETRVRQNRRYVLLGAESGTSAT